MALIFGVFTLSIAAIFYSKRMTSIIFIVIGLILILAMFWHHLTSTLQINL